jgi:hypothetical protein
MTTTDKTKLTAACRRVIRHCDQVLQMFQINNEQFEPWSDQHIEEIDFRRVLRKRESATLVLRALSIGQTPHPADIGQLMRDDGWQVREIVLSLTQQ